MIKWIIEWGRKEGGREGKGGWEGGREREKRKKYVDRFQRTRCVKREKKITSEN